MSGRWLPPEVIEKALAIIELKPSVERQYAADLLNGWCLMYSDFHESEQHEAFSPDDRTRRHPMTEINNIAELSERLRDKLETAMYETKLALAKSLRRKDYLQISETGPSPHGHVKRLAVSDGPETGVIRLTEIQKSLRELSLASGTIAGQPKQKQSKPIKSKRLAAHVLAHAMEHLTGRRPTRTVKSSDLYEHDAGEKGQFAMLCKLLYPHVFGDGESPSTVMREAVEDYDECKISVEYLNELAITGARD